LGAFFLFAAVIGSGIMAERLAGGNFAVALLANTLATVANPAITVARSLPPRSLPWLKIGSVTTVACIEYGP
jgi:hypothetical protein